MLNYLDDLYAIRDILNRNKLILSPGDTVWSIMCRALDPVAVMSLKEILGDIQADNMEIIISSISQLKKYIKSIHPRVETLLYYHMQPLSIYLKPNKNLPREVYPRKGNLAFRLTTDPLLSDLIDLLQEPILAVPATRIAGQYPLQLSDISDDIIKQVNCVLQTSPGNPSNPGPSVLVSCDKEGELIFHRQ